MKISEIPEKLEDLGNNLLIISETAGAVEASLDSGLLPVDQVCWALIGIVKGLEKAARDVDGMVKEAMELNKLFGDIYGRE